MKYLAFLFTLIISASAQTLTKEEIGKCWDKYNKLMNIEKDKAKKAGDEKRTAVAIERDVEAYETALLKEQLADKNISELRILKEKYKDDETGFCRAIGDRN